MTEQDTDRFTRDMQYATEHRRELLRQFPDRWVAVYNEQVVSSDKTPQRLFERLKKHGIPPSQVFVEYVTDQEDLLILAAGQA